MLNAILMAALRLRPLVLLTAASVLVLGAVLARRAPIDVLPVLDRPVVTVLTDAHGRVTEDVERLVTQPIERALLGAARVERVRSSSTHGFSTVAVDFDWSTDIYLARQIVAEKLQLVRDELPEGAEPVLGPVASIMGQIQIVGFQGDGGTSAFDIRRFVDREVVPRIRGLEGVAQVIALGGQPAQVTVAVDASKLRAFDVTLEEVASAVGGANVSGAGGTISRGAAGPQVALDGLIQEPADLESAAVRSARGPGDRPVRVGDVAEVAFGPTAVRVGDAGIDGGPGVLVVIAKQPSADTRQVTAAVDAEVAAIAPSLPRGVRATTDLFRQSAFIDRAIGNVVDAVRDGAILVVLVLFLFLLEIRTTLITISVIPLALAITAIVFAALGLSINTMTLGGLAVAIGTLVDDAIVDVENVYRRLRQNAAAPKPRPALRIVFEASSEIRRPVVYGTFVVTLVYLPLFFLSGIEGRLFAPVGIAFVVSVLASTAVALTVTPVLCYYLLGRVRATPTSTYGGPIVRFLHGVARALVALSIRRTYVIAAVSMAAVLLAGIEISRLGTAFLPPFNEGSAQVNLNLPPSTNLETSARYGQRLEQVLVGIEGVRSVARRTGREPGDEHAMPISVSEAIVVLDPDSGRSREAILDDIRHELAEEFPGVPSEVEQPLAHLLSHLLSGVTAQVAIKLTGVDLDELRSMQGEIERAVAGIDGVTDLYARPQVLLEELDVTPDRAALARFGGSVDSIARTVELAMGTEEVSRLQEGRLAIPIVVGLRQEDRREPESLGGLVVRSDASERGQLLRDVSQVRTVLAPNAIERENGRRLAVVQHNVSGRALGDVVAEVEAALAPIRQRVESMPGYGLVISGQFEAQREATRVIALVGLLAVALVVVVLRTHFRSLRLALLVLVTRPVAFVGGAMALASTGQDLSVAALVGFIALFGFAARNAILLLDHTLHLVAEESAGVSVLTITRAAEERIVPVLMTALTSGIGLVPLAMAADQPGKELLYPVATVILGGLITNTLLDFVLMPGLVWWAARDELEQLGRDAPDDLLLADEGA